MAHRPDRPILPRDRTARRDMERSRSAELRELSQRRMPPSAGRTTFGAGDSQTIYPWSLSGPLSERESAPQPALRATRTFTGARITLAQEGGTPTVGVLRSDGVTVTSWIIPALTAVWFSPFTAAVTVPAGSVMTVEITEPGDGAEGITVELA